MHAARRAGRRRSGAWTSTPLSILPTLHAHHDGPLDASPAINARIATKRGGAGVSGADDPEHLLLGYVADLAARATRSACSPVAGFGPPSRPGRSSAPDLYAPTRRRAAPSTRPSLLVGSRPRPRRRARRRGRPAGRAWDAEPRSSPSPGRRSEAARSPPRRAGIAADARRRRPRTRRAPRCPRCAAATADGLDGPRLSPRDRRVGGGEHERRRRRRAPGGAPSPGPPASRPTGPRTRSTRCSDTAASATSTSAGRRRSSTTRSTGPAPAATAAADRRVRAARRRLAGGGLARPCAPTAAPTRARTPAGSRPPSRARSTSASAARCPTPGAPRSRPTLGDGRAPTVADVRRAARLSTGRRRRGRARRCAPIARRRR